MTSDPKQTKMQCIRTVLYLLLLLFVMACSDDDANEVVAPDQVGYTVLYSKNPNGHNELYQLNDGVETVVLSDVNYDFWWPKVSPDKTKMLVYRSAVNPAKNHDDYANAELVLANIDGSDPQVLIGKNENGWSAQGVCRWNKDGSKILMCAIVETNAGVQWRLITTDNMGQNPKIVSDRWAIDCNYSIDNKSILFIGFPNNELSFDFTSIELQKADYNAQDDTISNIVSLTQNDSRDHDPAVSPDNTKVVFSGGNADYTNVDLKLFDLRSNQESVLLNDANTNGGSMCWSPDGRYVYFHSLKVFESSFRIKRININTRQVETILEAPNNGFGFYHPEVY